jgi:hypothetical protein
MAQIRGLDFVGAVMKRAQFGNAPLVDVEADDGNPGPRECSRHRQSDIAKPDDRDFPPVCHEILSPSLCGA